MKQIILVLFLLVGVSSHAQIIFPEHYKCSGEQSELDLWANQSEKALRINTGRWEVTLKFNEAFTKKYPSRSWYDQVDKHIFECCGPLPLDISTRAGLGSGMNGLPILQIYSPDMGIKLMSCTLLPPQ